MNRAEAEQAARLLWGKNGSAERRRDADRTRRFVVGVLAEQPLLGVTFQVKGWGASYVEAFSIAATFHDEKPMEMPSLGVIYEQAKAEALADLRAKAVEGARGSKPELSAEVIRHRIRNF